MMGYGANNSYGKINEFCYSHNTSTYSISEYSASFEPLRNLFNNLKSHVDNLINYFKEIRNNITNVINNLFILKIKEIKKELFSVTSKLNESPFFKREFYEFLKIKDMIEYILEKKEGNNFKFAEELLIKFSDLISKKGSYFNNIEKYDKLYKEFSNYLNKKEEAFFTEIYSSTFEYEDTVVKILNILE